MREMDAYGLKICKYQGTLFQESLERVTCSSPVFLRRFMNSELAVRMDTESFLFEAVDVSDAIEEVQKQFGESDYGSIQYGKNELYWMGYVYRYWAYTRECSTKSIYKIMKPCELKKLYFPYHSLDSSQAIERILESKNLLEEDMISKGVEILRKIRAK